MDDHVTEMMSLDHIYYGLITGRGGSGIREIKHVTGAVVTIEADNRCMIFGKQVSVNKAKDYIAQKVQRQIDEQRANARNEDPQEWRLVEFISNTKVCRERGLTRNVIENMQSRCNVTIYVDLGLQQLYLRGDDNDCEMARRELKYILNISYYHNYNRKKYFVSVKNDITTIPSQGNNPSGPVQHYSKTYENIPNLKQTLLDEFNAVKKEMEISPDVRSDIPMHWGTADYDKNRVFYRRLKMDSNIIKKIRLFPLIVKYYRFDLELFHPDSCTGISYQLYAKENEEGNMEFIKSYDVEDTEGKLEDIAAGAGVFFRDLQKLSRHDIIDTTSKFIIRMNISLSPRNEASTARIQSHVDVLKDTFYEQISIEKVDQEIKLILPPLDERYLLVYIRRCERCRYIFEKNNSFLISNDKVVFNIYPTDQAGDGVEVFYESCVLGKILRRQDWPADVLLDAIEGELTFIERFLEL